MSEPTPGEAVTVQAGLAAASGFVPDFTEPAEAEEPALPPVTHVYGGDSPDNN